jgi:hypothetical protein
MAPPVAPAAADTRIGRNLSMKKLLVLVLAAIGAGLVCKVISDQRAKASLWSEITDRVPGA